MKKTFANFSFTIFRGTNFREKVQNCALKVVYIYQKNRKWKWPEKVNFEKQVATDIEIAPLILLSLVENAFKHGAGEDGGSPEINILLQSEQKVFTFCISNTLVDAGIEKSKPSIGLENIKKQLELIYPNQHQLDID